MCCPPLPYILSKRPNSYGRSVAATSKPFVTMLYTNVMHFQYFLVSTVTHETGYYGQNVAQMTDIHNMMSFLPVPY